VQGVALRAGLEVDAGQRLDARARASGTNDKAGTVWNMIRFASPRSIKRNHLPVHDYRYPHLEP